MLKHIMVHHAVHVIVCLLAIPALAWADDYRSPDVIEGIQTIDAEELIGLANSRPSTIIIDSRTHADRIAGYIAGSIHLPDTRTNCESLASVAPDTETPVIFYCNGEHCDRSDRAAEIALICNYQLIYWFRGGMTEWLAKSYPVEN